MITAHLRYLSYVLRHKTFVFVAGLRTKAPLWRLLTHDWSKFTPAEWRPYVQNFYGSPRGWYARNPEAWKVRCAEAFDRAWLHHQHANPHHWQHWILREDSGATRILAMPEHFVREMVADWMGAGRAITGQWEVVEWYAKNRDRILLHEETRALVEWLLAEASGSLNEMNGATTPTP